MPLYLLLLVLPPSTQGLFFFVGVIGKGVVCDAGKIRPKTVIKLVMNRVRNIGLILYDIWYCL